MNFKHLVSISLFILILLNGLFWILLSRTIEKTDNKLHVVCTTNIIADAITTIAKDKIKLIMLMGPGVDPHLYKPIEQDVTSIAQADIIFYNGLHLEARMADLFKNMSKDKVTIAVTKDMPEHLLITSTEYEDHADPHVWFDPELWCYAIHTITETLCLHDPKHDHFYKKNSKKYIEQIKKMYQATKQLILSIPIKQRILITGHDAFEYFSRSYDCKVLSLQGISTESEAGTKDVQELAQFIYQQNIPSIFLETSIPSRNIEAVQQSLAAKSRTISIGGELYSDALGSSGTKEGTYLGMMMYNISTIVHGLTT